jgi:hypothetical protein
MTGTGDQVSSYFLNSLLMHFVDKPVVIPRIVSFIFGVLVIIPYYLLVRLAFPQEVALASVLALVFYPIHVQLSVVQMANAGSIFFVVLAGYFLMQYLYKSDSGKNKIYFTVSIISTILATTFRMDAWFLLIILPLLLLQEKGLKQAVIFFILSSLYIVSVCYVSYNTYGNPVFFLRNPLNLNPLIDPAAKKGIFRFLLTRADMPSYGKYQGFVWFKTIFYTLSFPLSFLGFLGMLAAFKNKKQYIFFISFWIFLLMLTLKQIISNCYPFPRYSSIFVIFFLPFVFLGVSMVAEYIQRLLLLSDFYKRMFVVSLIVITSVYFIFFSVEFLIKDIPKMKYNSFVYTLSDWIGKNIHSQDIIICSFNDLNLPLYVSRAEIINKFIGGLYGNDEIFNILNNEKERRLDKKTIDEIIDFAQSSPKALNGAIYIRLLIKRGDSPEPKRIVFILDYPAYTYLKDHFPDLFQRLETKHYDFIYGGILLL